MLNAIEKSKSNSLDKLINGFGIRYIGLGAARLLAENFESMDAIMEEGIERLLQVDEIGGKMAESIVKFFGQEQARHTIKRLNEAGVNMKGNKREIIDNRFEGQIFVLTGTLERYSRQQASEIIESFGGKTAGSVSKKTSFVLAGEEAGSKLDKANELGIRVISEREFNGMIKKERG